MKRISALAGACLLACAALSDAATHELKATKDTVHWGYFSKTLPHKLSIKSGDEVTVEMVSHHCGDDPDLMIKGDKNLEEIYAWGPKGPGTTHETAMRGMTGSGDGVHILTGPIYVDKAEPGDILKVEILDLYPRVNRNGEAYGVNAAAWWGFHYGINGGMEGKADLLGLLNNSKREVTNVYKAVFGKNGNDRVAAYGMPWYQAQYAQNAAVVTDCLQPVSDVPGAEREATNFNPGVEVPCIDGKQTWTGYNFPGLLTDTSKVEKDLSVQGRYKIPANLHVGCMGLAPSEVDFADSVPPMPYGGNLDNRRIGVGATMYYPVAVEGALLSMGDSHFAQGDGELDGTAIEMSVTGRFKISLIKAYAAKDFKKLDFPVLENKHEWLVHGFSYQNYLTELSPPSSVYGKSSVDRATANAMRNARTLLMNKGYTEDEAVTILSTAADFGITQLVDGNWGAHCIIPKFAIMEVDADKDTYQMHTFTGSSQEYKSGAAAARAAPGLVAVSLLLACLMPRA